MYSISSNTSFNSDAGQFQQPSVSMNIVGMNETAIAPASFQALPVTHTYLESALQSAQAKLQQFALSSDGDKLNFVFGTDWNHTVMQTLLTEWQQGNFSNLPQIDLLTGAQLNGANGAYSAETNTIYLSTDLLLNPGNAAEVTNVLLEEIGHAIDSKINATDTPGDEGDLFQRMIQATAITPEEVMMLKTEDDTAILSLNNRTFLVEQSTVRPFNGTSDGIVNIRRGPGTNHTAVGSLQLNQRATFDAVATGTTHWDARERINENRWFRIQGTNNWVSAAFITGNPVATPPTPPPSSNTFTGSSDGIVNIRTGPGTNNLIAGTLQLNQRVTFDSVARGTTHWDARERFNDDRWFRIQGTNNWVSAAFITGEPTTGGSTQPQPQPSTGGGSPLLIAQGAQYFNSRLQFYGRSGNIFAASGVGSSLVDNGGRTVGNCTWYAHGRVKELGGNAAALNSMRGHAHLWHTQLSNGSRILGAGETPRLGDIAQWSSQHVAVVERVFRNASGALMITISESHYPFSGVRDTLHQVRDISANNPTRFIRVPGVRA